MKLFMVSAAFLIGCVPIAYERPRGSAAAAMLISDEPVAQRPLSDLRTQHGACASTRVADSEAPSLYVSVSACALVGVAFTTMDDDKSRVIVHLDSGTFSESNPGSWLVTVLGPDGVALLNREPMNESVPSVGECDSYGCRKLGIGILRLPAAWGPGSYRVQVMLKFDTRRVADLRLSLR